MDTLVYQVKRCWQGHSARLGGPQTGGRAPLGGGGGACMTGGYIWGDTKELKSLLMLVSTYISFSITVYDW